jgi:hypothetical protein
MSLARFAIVALASLVLVVSSLERGSPAAAGDGDAILEFDTMVGVTGPFVGGANPIREIGGGGVPWRIDRGRGELGTDGDLEIDVRGLVLATTGQNPQAAFRAVVSCLSIGATGGPTTVNVTTDPFPATPEGDATIEALLSLPSPCIAPIIFVGTGAGAFRWFASTGM